jgi:aspartyl protease family protein
MKQFIKLLIPITGFALFYTTEITFGTFAAIAQETQLCFMTNSSGQTFNLSNLCGGSTKKASTNSKVFHAKIKRRESGIPVIDVTFNGQQKFEMLLDTGASQTMITQEMADALKVVPVGRAKVVVASGDVIESPEGSVASIGVGDVVVKEAAVSIGAVPLLGQNFFGGYDMIIRQNVVEFHAH